MIIPILFTNIKVPENEYSLFENCVKNMDIDESEIIISYDSVKIQKNSNEYLPTNIPILMANMTVLPDNLYVYDADDDTIGTKKKCKNHTQYKIYATTCVFTHSYVCDYNGHNDWVDFEFENIHVLYISTKIPTIKNIKYNRTYQSGYAVFDEWK